MFKSICINQHDWKGNSDWVDVGLLAEAMLFYEDVRVIGGYGTLRQLIKGCGPDILIELLASKRLHFTYLDNQFAISTDNQNPRGVHHKTILFTGQDFELNRVARKLFTEVTGRAGRGRRLANRFAGLVETIQYDTSLTSGSIEDFADSSYVTKAIELLLGHFVPSYTQRDPIFFTVRIDQDEFTIETNVDFSRANQLYHKAVSPQDPWLTEAFLLVQLMRVRSNLYFASTYSSELLADEVSKKLIQAKFEDLLHPRDKGMELVTRFQDFVFDDSRTIREVINGGERSFADILAVLDSATKFRHWLHDQPEDVKLIRAYLEEITKSSWIERLPSKSIRWLLFTGAGLGLDALGGLGIGSLVLSVVDTFLLDQLIQGWKPNQFIEGPLYKFMGYEE